MKKICLLLFSFFSGEAFAQVSLTLMSNSQMHKLILIFAIPQQGFICKYYKANWPVSDKKMVVE